MMGTFPWLTYLVIVRLGTPTAAAAFPTVVTPLGSLNGGEDEAATMAVSLPSSGDARCA
jgi:hypothetical protein